MDHRNLKKSVLIVECSIKLLCCCTDLPSPKGCVRPSVDDAKYYSASHVIMESLAKMMIRERLTLKAKIATKVVHNNPQI